MIEALVGLFITLIGSYVGSIEWRLRTMDDRLRKAISKDDILELIDIKQESVEVLQKELKEDIRDINHKLDKIIDKQLSED